MPATQGYVNTMSSLLAKASKLLEASESDESSRLDLIEKLETMIDLACMQGHSLHRPQIDCMAPPMLDT